MRLLAIVALQAHLSGTCRRLAGRGREEQGMLICDFTESQMAFGTAFGQLFRGLGESLIVDDKSSLVGAVC